MFNFCDLRSGQQPLWPYYCDADPDTSGVSHFIKAFLSTLFTGWIPSLINALWFGMLVPLISYLCIQVCKVTLFHPDNDDCHLTHLIRVSAAS